MIDLIIPSYNDFYGLCATLQSLGFYSHNFYNELPITIIDDASTNFTKEQYRQIEEMFPYLNLNILYLPENKGPGYVRQYGIDHTKEPFILFIDCGNLFANQLSIIDYFQHLDIYPNTLCFSPPYIYELAPGHFSLETANTEFHGSLFSRQFLIDYNLKIPTAFSYLHEDCPFLTVCHQIADAIQPQWNLPQYGYTVRTYNENSTTTKDNHGYYYQHAVEGYIKNSLQILQNLRNVDNNTQILLKQILFLAAHNIYITTVCNNNSSNIQQAEYYLFLYYKQYKEFLCDWQSPEYVILYHAILTSILVNTETQRIIKIDLPGLCKKFDSLIEKD